MRSSLYVSKFLNCGLSITHIYNESQLFYFSHHQLLKIGFICYSDPILYNQVNELKSLLLAGDALLVL